MATHQTVQEAIDAVERVFHNQFARREAVGRFAAATGTLPDAERHEAMRALSAMYERQRLCVGPAQDRILQEKCIGCGAPRDAAGPFCLDCVDEEDRGPV